jgi:membrane protease YdiL (CAAX protease family)
MLSRSPMTQNQRTRLVIGTLLVVLVLAAAHAGLTLRLPWAGGVDGGLQTSAALSVLLLLVAAILPRRRGPLAARGVPRDDPALALGLLLVCEPALLFMILLWSGHAASALSVAIILPDHAPAEAGLGSIAGQLLILAGLAPIAEETLFRDRLLPWLAVALERLGAGRAAGGLAVAVSALAFSFAHADPVRAMIALPLGLLLGAIRWRSPDLHGCILAHAVHNSLLVGAGSALITETSLPLLLALSGCALLLLHRFHRHGPPTPRRLAEALGALALISLVALALAPAIRHWHDRLWVAALDHQLRACGGSDRAVLDRVEFLRRSGMMDAARCSELFTALSQAPWPDGEGGSADQAAAQTARRTCLLADLDAVRLADGIQAAEAYDRLLDLATAERPSSMIVASALRIGLRFPDAFASVAGLSPAVLSSWLPLPAARPACVALVAASHGRARRQLLTALEVGQPGQVAAVILQMPAEQLGALDRRHLFLYYPDAPRLLGALQAHDPARYRALTGSVEH